MEQLAVVWSPTWSVHLIVSLVSPFFHAAIQIGVPAEIVRAWAAAVIGIKRFFWVRGQPSEGVRSGTGFPEGCALSVAAMGLCNLVIHSFHGCPLSPGFSCSPM